MLRNRPTLMKNRCVVVVAFALTCVAAFAASKTFRVDHGRPIIVVSEKQVLALEFIKEPVEAALVHYSDKPNWDHCRAKYRFQVYDTMTGAITNGAGVVEEIYEVVSRSATGAMIEDRGSKTHIAAGAFGLTWSKASAGARSWLYYHAASNVRFIQQPERLPFNELTGAAFARFQAAQNVTEFVAAGKSVQVIGPAVFAGDLPTDSPASGRVEFAGIRDGAFRLKLSNLATNKHYVIDISYEVKSANWNAVHTFTAREPTHEWSDPLARDVNVTFYRIRQAAF